MAELVDASDSKSDSERSAGSIPARGTSVFYDYKILFRCRDLLALGIAQPRATLPK